KKILDSSPPGSPPPKATPSAGPGDEGEGTTFLDLVVWFGSDDDDEDQPRSAQASSLSAAHRPSEEPSFDFSSGDTAGEEAVPAPTEGSSPAGGAGDASSPARSNISGGEGTLLVPLSRTPLRRALSPPASPRRRLPPLGSARSRASSRPQEAGPGRMIVTTYTSSFRYGDPSPAQSLPMSHQVVQGLRPAVLPSASFPPWVQPYLDMSFTAPGAKSCFERVFSRVLPDPTPGDVVIRVTIERLRASSTARIPIICGRSCVTSYHRNRVSPT
ncbi:hypothetical protein JG687_00018187, partial [Phytophthora cactorum]